MKTLMKSLALLLALLTLCAPMSALCEEPGPDAGFTLADEVFTDEAEVLGTELPDVTVGEWTLYASLQEKPWALLAVLPGDGGDDAGLAALLNAFGEQQEAAVAVLTEADCALDAAAYPALVLSTDIDAETYKALGGGALPLLVMADRHARAVYIRHGAVTPEELKGETSVIYFVTAVNNRGAALPEVIMQFCTEDACRLAGGSEDGLVIFSGPADVYQLKGLQAPEGYRAAGAEALLPPLSGLAVLMVPRN